RLRNSVSNETASHNASAPFLSDALSSRSCSQCNILYSIGKNDGPSQTINPFDGVDSVELGEGVHSAPSSCGNSIHSDASSAWSGAFKSMDGAVGTADSRTKAVPLLFTRTPAASPMLRTRRQRTPFRHASSGKSGSWPASTNNRHSFKTGEEP